MSEAPRSLDDLLDTAVGWRDIDPDPETRAELNALIAMARAGGIEKAGPLVERFGGRLEFGTAGLRGELGVGPMRMNQVVVRQAAAGLARWLPAASTVVIGFDARHKSDVFAGDSARVLAAAGHRALVFPHVCPTPVLAYALRHVGADAGIMCTASHNPARDNGYKVYVGDGAQIIPPVDAEIAAAIVDAAAGPIVLAPEDDPAIGVVGPEVLEAYLDHVVGLVPAGPRALRIAYTPMHGVGGAVTLEAFRRAGFADLHVVESQEQPDPDFPTVAFPNPEEPGALDRAEALAREVSADLVIANDPDADRLGVMAADRDGGGFTALTGNEIGALLAERILATTTGPDRLVVTTFVSSHLLARMAEAEAVHYAEVPTGFKWVVRPGLTDPTRRFVFGFEEALGFSVDEVVRDKDGIERGAALRRAGRSGGGDGRIDLGRARAAGPALRGARHPHVVGAGRGPGRGGPDLLGHGPTAGRPSAARRLVGRRHGHRSGRGRRCLPGDRRRRARARRPLPHRRAAQWHRAQAEGLRRGGRAGGRRPRGLRGRPRRRSGPDRSAHRRLRPPARPRRPLTT